MTVDSPQPDDGTDFPDLQGAVAYRVSCSCRERADLGVGDHVAFTKRLTDGGVHAVAQATGDTNPLHLDGGYAARTRFDGRIAHGVLVGGLVSAALARLPGVTIYLSEERTFVAPVRVGTVATATAVVAEAFGDHRYRLDTRVEADGETVIEGEATVLLDEAPDRPPEGSS